MSITFINCPAESWIKSQFCHRVTLLTVLGDGSRTSSWIWFYSCCTCPIEGTSHILVSADRSYPHTPYICRVGRQVWSWSPWEFAHKGVSNHFKFCLLRIWESLFASIEACLLEMCRYLVQTSSLEAGLLRVLATDSSDMPCKETGGFWSLSGLSPSICLPKRWCNFQVHRRWHERGIASTTASQYTENQERFLGSFGRLVWTRVWKNT